LQANIGTGKLTVIGLTCNASNDAVIPANSVQFMHTAQRNKVATA